MPPRRRPPASPRPQAPTAPRRRPGPSSSTPSSGPGAAAPFSGSAPSLGSALSLNARLADRGRRGAAAPLHPLSDAAANACLLNYDQRTKASFDRIVPVLKQLSALQHEPDFVAQAQQLAQAELGYALPLPILESAWVTQLDMRTLFAWCVFEAYGQASSSFFGSDPLGGHQGSQAAESFNAFLLECGFHLLDVTPCADGRLAHAIGYALRIPYSSVRRRPHAGAMFDIKNTVDRWVKTEHLRYREAKPNPAQADTRYLKVVVYHFSSIDPTHQGCAAHASDDAAAAAGGMGCLQDFRSAIENSFCCGASVDLLLIGLDTDTDAIRVHVPGLDGSTNLDRWLDAQAAYEATAPLPAAQGRAHLLELVEQAAASTPDPGMVKLVAKLLENNISQIDYVRQFHGGAYGDAGHAERFIGVGIGFKEIHLRNLTYFAYLETLEEGAADLDVGVKIFKGLNGSRGLPIPVVVRFDYRSSVPGARERAIHRCERLQQAIGVRYADLCRDGLLHTLLTIRDQDRDSPVEAVGSSITFAKGGGH